MQLYHQQLMLLKIMSCRLNLPAPWTINTMWTPSHPVDHPIDGYIWPTGPTSVYLPGKSLWTHSQVNLYYNLAVLGTTFRIYKMRLEVGLLFPVNW